MDLQFETDRFALITDWRNPYTDGIHGDWRPQVRYALGKSENHIKLAAKLDKFAPFILVYSKIRVNREEYERLAGFSHATICVISSSGEHLLTPWMIVHNIGHTIISWNIWIKTEIMKIIGLTSHDDSVIEIQRDLVDSQASRKLLIPNINEVIYELFTTWVWFGRTKSPMSRLAEFCDKTFPALMDKYKGDIFWHQYRHPISKHRDLPWLEEIVSNLDDVTYTPGVPGFTSKVLKERTF